MWARLLLAALCAFRLVDRKDREGYGAEKLPDCRYFAATSANRARNAGTLRSTRGFYVHKNFVYRLLRSVLLGEGMQVPTFRLGKSAPPPSLLLQQLRAPNGQTLEVAKSKVMVGNLFGVLFQPASSVLADTFEQTRQGDERDQVIPVLGLLQTAKGHLGPGNVLLGVLKVLIL